MKPNNVESDSQEADFLGFDSGAAAAAAAAETRAPALPRPASPQLASVEDTADFFSTPAAPAKPRATAAARPRPRPAAPQTVDADSLGDMFAAPAQPAAAAAAVARPAARPGAARTQPAAAAAVRMRSPSNGGGSGGGGDLMGGQAQSSSSGTVMASSDAVRSSPYPAAVCGCTVINLALCVQMLRLSGVQDSTPRGTDIPYLKYVTGFNFFYCIPRQIFFKPFEILHHERAVSAALFSRHYFIFVTLSKPA